MNSEPKIMVKILLILGVVAVGLFLVFGSKKSVASEPAPDFKETELKGFDSNGDPVIREMSDGSLYLVFNFFPPSDLADEEDPSKFDDFDVQLQKEIGVPVHWEDRELFLIREPTKDTVQQITNFIQGYRAK